LLNLEIRKFRDSIILLANNSPIPTEAKRLVLCEVKNMIEQEADKEIISESKQEKRSE
jgi:hypothetical protein